MHRPTLAILTLSMLLGALAIQLWSPDGTNSGLAGFQGALVRMGILLAALWVAEPQLRRIPPWMILVGVVGGVLLLVGLKSPSFYRLAIPVFVLLWMTRRSRAPLPPSTSRGP
jgi:hypothetical protein